MEIRFKDYEFKYMEVSEETARQLRSRKSSPMECIGCRIDLIKDMKKARLFEATSEALERF